VVAAVCENYGQMLKSTIVLETFYTSAVAHIPLSLSSNIRRVVAQSGYIQSAGFSIYVRRAERADQKELDQRLDAFLAPILAKNARAKIYLTPYAIEYFNPYEARDTSISVRNGLDGVRLDLRKHFLSGQPLRDVLHKMAIDRSSLHVAKGLVSYNAEIRAARSDRNLTNEYTIWIISDTRYIRPDETMYVRAKEPYLIVYAQYQNNANQFILYKERKPAWVASVTLPHTLSIACLNIAREAAGRRRTAPSASDGLSIPRAHVPVIVDPFCVLVGS
jgi:hypothetical protein